MTTSFEPKPTDVIISTEAVEGTEREKVPLESVEVATVEFFTMTEAPNKGVFFSSLTIPLIVFVCAETCCATKDSTQTNSHPKGCHFLI
jgi:hypothetical protein